jgi:hypothetical protein
MENAEFEFAVLDDLERRFMDLVSDAGLPEPDEVCKDTRTGELTFLWHNRRLAVVVGPDGEVRGPRGA